MLGLCVPAASALLVACVLAHIRRRSRKPICLRSALVPPCPNQINEDTAPGYLPTSDTAQVLARQFDATYTRVKVRGMGGGSGWLELKGRKGLVPSYCSFILESISATTSWL